MGVRLSRAIRRKAGREPPRLSGQARTGRQATERQDPAFPPRAGRKHAEGPGGSPREGEQSNAWQTHHPGGPRLVDAEILHRVGDSWPRLLRDRDVRRQQLLGSSWSWPQRWLGSPPVGPELFEEAPREGFSEGAAGCGRRDRPRHQGGPATVQIDQGGRRRIARTAPRRIQHDHRNPGDRHAAWRRLRPPLRADAGAGGKFLRHRRGDPAKVGRQPFGSSRQPVQGAA